MHMGDVIKFPNGQLPLGVPPERVQFNRPGPPAKQPRICWACGIRPRRGREQYCHQCEAKGEAQPWVECKHPDCRLVTKRIRPGQQFFWCNEHRPTGAGA